MTESTGTTRSLTTQCAIAGGGPAGLMLGYLLARQGVQVVVLEKHADFLRDFRGDTVHPSTLEVFHELGLLDGLLARPHQKTQRIGITIAERSYAVADFAKLRAKCRYIAMMPQWDFLDFLACEARKMPNFQLLMSTTAEALIDHDGRVRGVQASCDTGRIEIEAQLTVAADGRDSVLRKLSGLPLLELGAPIDVFWMKLARGDDRSSDSLARVSADGLLVLINRGDHWQCALPFPKGAAQAIRAQGLPAFRARVARIAPFLTDASQVLTSWDQIKLLTVQVNRLSKWWRDGFLCIGDAAHAMSPIGGVGINLAIQDAVAAGRILGPQLRDGTASNEALAAVAKRRAWPTRMTQSAQIALHERILVPVITASKPLRAPLVVRLLDRFPSLRGLPARAIGLGLRPEHVE